MNNTMGDVIRKLRHERNLTQEELGEYLGVSFQAVSKWENGQGMPDIMQIVPLANFFGVSTDTLFTFCSEDKKKEMEEYHNKSLELRNVGKIDENILLWKEASGKYPGNYDCLIELANTLLSKACHIGDPSEKERLSKECLDICNRIMANCSDSDILGKAKELSVYLYSSPWLSFANEEKAVELAKSAGCIWNSAEMLLDHAYYTEANKVKSLANHENNILTFMDYIGLYLMLQSDKSPKEQLMFCQEALSLWKTLIPDENYLFYHCRIADIYKIIAKEYAKLGKAEDSLQALKKAKYHCQQYDTLPKGELHFTCPWLDHTTTNRDKSTKNYEETDYELFKQSLIDSCFDFVRNKPEFADLMKE